MTESEERSVVVESNGPVMDHEDSENPTPVEIEGTTMTTKDQNNTKEEKEKAKEKETDQKKEKEKEKEITLLSVFHRLFTQIFFPDYDDRKTSTHLLQRIKTSVYHNAPYLREASRNSTKNLLLWTRQGSPLRALLVISVGTITLLALTGLLVFMLFFLAATTNAVIISLFMSLAAVGGFLAIFFACITAVYVGALSVAVIVISTATITTIIAVLITTGWLAFFYAVWWVTKKSIGFAGRSLNATTSALSAYSTGRQDRHLARDKASTMD